MRDPKLAKLIERANVYVIEVDGSEVRLGSVIEQMATALEWYGEEVLTYSITQMSEPRSAAHADKGKRARSALQL